MNRTFIALFIQSIKTKPFIINGEGGALRIKAQNREEARESLYSYVRGEWWPESMNFEVSDWFDFMLDRIILFEVIDEEEIVVDDWYSEAETDWLRQMQVEFTEKILEKSKNRRRDKWRLNIEPKN